MRWDELTPDQQARVVKAAAAGCGGSISADAARIALDWACGVVWTWRAARGNGQVLRMGATALAAQVRVDDAKDALDAVLAGAAVLEVSERRRVTVRAVVTEPAREVVEAAG
jgi:hypothetical protein